jgi:hypothetical protein
MTLAASGAPLVGHPWPNVCTHAPALVCVCVCVSQDLYLRDK